MSLLCVLANVQPFVRLKFTFSHLCAQSDGGASLLWELSVTAREVFFLLILGLFSVLMTAPAFLLKAHLFMDRSMWRDSLISFSLFPGVGRVLEGGGGLLEDGVFASVPLGKHSLFLEASILPPVVNRREDFPHENEGEADCHDGTDHAKDNAHDVHHHRALFGCLHPNLN